MKLMLQTKAAKWIEAGLLSIAAIFAPIQQLLLTTGVMIFADLVLGIMAARKRNEKITSAGLRRTLSKIFVYELALCFAFLAERYISDVLPFVKLCSAMIALVEIQSIYENLNEISGSDLLSSLIKRVGSSNQE